MGSQYELRGREHGEAWVQGRVERLRGVKNEGGGDKQQRVEGARREGGEKDHCAPFTCGFVWDASVPFVTEPSRALLVFTPPSFSWWLLFCRLWGGGNGTGGSFFADPLCRVKNGR